MFKCNGCGYIHNGDEAPENCPKCGAPREKFEKLEDEAASTIQKSRFTNDLHMHLSSLLQEAAALSADGTNENLDPSCVAIFEKTQKFAEETIQAIKAELQTHVSKGKWG